MLLFFSLSAHPSCLHLPQEVVCRIRKLRWCCIDCKRCTMCHYSGDTDTKAEDDTEANEKDNDLLLCDSCDRGYHLTCVAPDLTKPPDGTWNCPICLCYPKGYAEPNPGGSSTTTSENCLLDPRLQAAALCDVLTDYEAQLIRKALSRRPHDATAIASPGAPGRRPRGPHSKSKSTGLVQKPLTNWTMKLESKQKGD